VARRLFASGIVVESAGFIGPGRPAPAEAVAVAAERGIDLTPHRSQLIMADHLQNADVVVVMNLEQRRRLVALQQALAARVVLLGDLDPQSITQRTVPDPVDQPAEAFRSCYDRIDRCVGLLAAPWRECGDDDVQRKGRQR
jgi:protein-tyrosine phosphatase